MLTKQICCLMRSSCFQAQGVTLHAHESRLQNLAADVFGFETALVEQVKPPKTILTAVQRTKDRSQGVFYCSGIEPTPWRYLRDEKKLHWQRGASIWPA